MRIGAAEVALERVIEPAALIGGEPREANKPIREVRIRGGSRVGLQCGEHGLSLDRGGTVAANPLPEVEEILDAGVVRARPDRRRGPWASWGQRCREPPSTAINDQRATSSAAKTKAPHS